MHLRFLDLKAKQREIRSEFPESLGLRVHRCLSWLNRAEQASGDDDASFFFGFRSMQLMQKKLMTARSMENDPLLKDIFIG